MAIISDKHDAQLSALLGQLASGWMAKRIRDIELRRLDAFGWRSAVRGPKLA